MSQNEKLRVPVSLEKQLLDYRRRVRQTKMTEAIAIAISGFVAAFLVVYFWDRLSDMPGHWRLALFVAVGMTACMIPWFFLRWVVRYTKLESLSQLLAQKLPSIGDQLLGVIELSKSESEQARSLELCQAAMDQVASDAKSRDFLTATPPSRFRVWAGIASLLGAAAIALAMFYPAASANSLARLLVPWNAIPRYTFTKIQPVPDEVIVAHGESAQLTIKLDEQTRSQPSTATLMIGDQTPIMASLDQSRYVFDVPPQIDPQSINIRIGDVRQTALLSPKMRPELSGITANVKLPDYLGRTKPQKVDARAGRISLVKGSSAVVSATANRLLKTGSINEVIRQPDGDTFISDSVSVELPSALKFQWQDHFGLAGREPFDLSVEAIDDEAPTLMVDGLPRQAVVLDSQMLKFTIRCNDDFGIQRTGLMWRSLDPRFVNETIQDEKTLAAGGYESSQLEAVGTFSAKSLGIEPQPIELFVWAEDYLPNRERVFSAPHVLYILTPDQHAIWMTEQLSKWHRQALDVRDRERQLYESNKQLRDLPPNQLDLAENRDAVERQATAERANGRRLDRLGKLGDQLIQEASRNPELGVGHLERWAEMLQVLQDLSENRMPSVADLLDDASKSESKLASAQPASPQSPKAGQSRAGGKPGQREPHQGEQPKLRNAPQLVDMESSANSPDNETAEPGPPKKPSSPALRLPVTTVMGKTQAGKKPKPQDQKGQVEQAVKEQKDLLAEFDKLADEMNEILANLEGSTLVKRLKAASRKQDLVAAKLTNKLQPTFGRRSGPVKGDLGKELQTLKESEEESVQTVSYIMDDMAAYFQRRRFMRFKTTLDEMKSSDVLGGLRNLAEKIEVRQGLSVAQSEFWADSLDRWAENLVDPACNGCCPGGKSPESLPPSIVLEVLQILEAEINLREETRVAEQAKQAIEKVEYQESAQTLSKSQSEIDQRVVKVIARIRELPEAERHFIKELKMLTDVDRVMKEAAEILDRPDTGDQAIAAETEAIELMLRNKRINPNGGGGGGASPGGGGSGNTVDSALALVGKGRNEKEVRRENGVSQTTGDTGTVYPEEFRQGLDQYFSRLGDS